MPPIPEGLLTLTDIQNEARDTKIFHFETKALFDFKAGQFISLKFGEKSWRAYSIASTPNTSKIELLIRIIPEGLASSILDKATIGDTFIFRGPYGHFVLSEKSNPITFCATGTGIAPIRSMILTELQKENPRPIELWYGGRDPDDIAYLDELAQLPIAIKLAFSQLEEKQLPTYTKENIIVHTGRITQFIQDHQSLTTNHSQNYYICGNGDMVKSVESLLKEKGIDKKSIIKERFN